MNAIDLERLVFNPFHISKILHHFMSGVQTINKGGIKTELIYMVLPFIYHNEICNKLSKLNKNSKLNTIITDPNFEIFINSDLNIQIKKFKSITKKGLIVLANNVEVDFGEYLVVNDKISYLKEEETSLKHVYKSAYVLGVLLAKERFLTVFKKLKIVEL